MPWMKVLRKPRLNSTVVRVAVDTAVNLSRFFSLSGMAAPFCQRRLRPCGGLSILVAPRVGLYTGAAPTGRHVAEERQRGDRQTIRRLDPSKPRPVLGSPPLPIIRRRPPPAAGPRCPAGDPWNV